jgi:hypothetical protein
MPNELIKSKRTVLSVMVFAFVTQGCANQAIAPNQELAAVTAPSEVQAKGAPQSFKPAPPPAPMVEQYALDRLKQMSDKLAATQAFTYRSSSSIEMSAVTGQFLTFFIDSEVALQRPNKLRVDLSGDLSTVQLYFDGANVSAFDPKNNLHADAHALATIDDVLDFVINKARINFPSGDFLYSNPYAVMSKDLTHAIIVGPSMVNGVPCEHFAYMNPSINWEVWIEKGVNALPMRLAMTYKKAPNFPRFLIEFADWNLNPKLNADTFVFKAPANAKQIEFGHYQPEPKK